MGAVGDAYSIPASRLAPNAKHNWHPLPGSALPIAQRHARRPTDIADTTERLAELCPRILASLERICHCDRHGLFTLSVLIPNFAMEPFLPTTTSQAWPHHTLDYDPPLTVEKRLSRICRPKPSKPASLPSVAKRSARPAAEPASAFPFTTREISFKNSSPVTPRR
jgi:hypothetical protein